MMALTWNGLDIALMQSFNVIALLHYNVLHCNVYNENKGKRQCDVDDNDDGSGNGD